MRRWVAHLAAAALLLTTSAAVAESAPGITCAQTTIAFGVRLNEEALALDEIYFDGVVPVPVSFGLQRGLMTITDQAELVTRGLVQLDVADASGTALVGSVEIVGNLLVWVGEKAFEKNATYELAYSFANDQISLCPEGVPQSGVIRFTTGQRSAKQDFAEISLDAKLEAKYVPEPGCCTVRDPVAVVPSSTPCLTTGTCVACWDSVLQVGGASAYASTAAPFSYFKLDFSLLADDLPQPVTYQNFGNVRFAVTDAASQYCVQAELITRGPVAARSNVSQCFSSDTFLQSAVLPEFTALPVDACAEDVQLTLAQQKGTRLQARFGSTEEEALRALHPMFPELRGPQGDDVARDDCALHGRSANSRGAWLLALLVIASPLLRRTARSSK